MIYYHSNSMEEAYELLIASVQTCTLSPKNGHHFYVHSIDEN